MKECIYDRATSYKHLQQELIELCAGYMHQALPGGTKQYRNVYENFRKRLKASQGKRPAQISPDSKLQSEKWLDNASKTIPH